MPDLERPADIARLGRQVRATPDNPLLMFVTMTSAQVVRKYPVQLSTVQ